MNILIDTSVLIDHLRGGTTWRRVVNETKEDTKLFVPTIVFFELFSGKSTKEPTIVSKINRLLSNFQRVDLTEEIAVQAGQLARDMKRTIQAPDYIIAASALDLGAKVLTLNKKHFEQIPNLNLYPD